MGTKKWPARRSENAGGPLYEATAISGRVKTGDGSTEQCSPSGQGHQAGIGEELARLLGPVGVRLAHRFLGRRVVVLVGIVEHRPPIVRPARVASELLHLGVQPRVLVATHLAQRPSIEVEPLALAQLAAVALLA